MRDQGRVKWIDSLFTEGYSDSVWLGLVYLEEEEVEQVAQLGCEEREVFWAVKGAGSRGVTIGDLKGV